MSHFVHVGPAEEIPPGSRKLVDFEEVSVAVFNLDGQFFCIEDVCSHDGGPVAEGELQGHVIACPRHGATFDVRDGRVLSMPAVVGIPTYEVKIEDGQIWVESPDSW